MSRCFWLDVALSLDMSIPQSRCIAITSQSKKCALVP